VKIPGGSPINNGTLANLGGVIVAGIDSLPGSALQKLQNINGNVCQDKKPAVPDPVGVRPISFRKRVAIGALWLRP